MFRNAAWILRIYMDIMYLHLIDDKIITANIREFVSSNKSSLRSAVVLSVMNKTRLQSCVA